MELYWIKVEQEVQIVAKAFSEAPEDDKLDEYYTKYDKDCELLSLVDKSTSTKLGKYL